MYGITTLDPSMNFPADGFGFCWFSVRVWLVERAVQGSDYLVGFCEVILFFCKKFMREQTSPG